MRKKIYIRADGNNLMGLGHVYRSFAVADMLNEKFDCRLIIKNPTEKLKEEAKKYFNNILEISEDASRSEEFEVISSLVTREDILVLDGYAFDTGYQHAVRQMGCKLVCIDDIHAYEFVADVVINHAVGINPADYVLRQDTRLYLGPEYALLRRPFLEAARNGKQKGDHNSIFVCLGGADPTNRSLDVIKHISKKYKLKQIGDFQIHIVLGSAYKHTASLLEHIPSNLQVYNNLSSDEMIALMQRCGIAVCSPSTITFEYVAVSKGKLFLCKTADNQKDFYKHMIQTGAAKVFFEDFGSESDAGRHNSEEDYFSSMLDGCQDKRILDIFCDLTH